MLNTNEVIACRQHNAISTYPSFFLFNYNIGAYYTNQLCDCTLFSITSLQLQSCINPQENCKRELAILRLKEKVPFPFAMNPFYDSQ